MFTRIARLLRNPTVQRILAWAAPLIIGWILSKLDKKAEQDQKKPRKRK